MHARFYQHPGLHPPAFDFATWPEFWSNLDGIGFGAACDTGFASAEHVIPRRLFKRAAEIWPASQKSVEISELFVGLVYGVVRFRPLHARMLTGTIPSGPARLAELMTEFFLAGIGEDQSSPRRR